MSYFTLARDIRYKISQGKVPEAIKTLQEAVKDQPDYLNDIVVKSSQHQSLIKQINRGTISFDEAEMAKSRIIEGLLEIANELEEKETRETRIFISYSHKEPDRTLAQAFHDELEKEGFYAFLAEKDIVIGEEWLNRIQQEVISGDFFLLLLSERSNESDMVLKEVKMAKYMQEVHPENKPNILPVRVKLPFEFPLNYDLNGYLEGIQHARWDSHADTAKVIKDIIQAIKSPNKLGDLDLQLPPEISGGNIDKAKLEAFHAKPLPKAELESPYASVALESPYYIERKGEHDFMQAIARAGAVLRIKGPRQFGKTSLLARLVAKARHDGFHVSTLSMQFMDTLSLTELDSLLKKFCVHISDDLELDRKSSRGMLKELWEDEFLDSKMKCSTFFQDFIFKEIPGPFFLAMDEADRIFSHQQVSDDFFGMLRSWHDLSRVNPVWERFRLAVSYSTEIHLAIKNMDQSPFNIGLESRLEVFTHTEVRDLISRHGLQFSGSEVDGLMQVFGGHPFLTRKALYLIATGELTHAHLMETAADDDGPFRDHLKRHLWNLSQIPESKRVMKSIIQHGASTDPVISDKLRSAGLAKGSFPKMEASLGLYTSFFSNRL